MQTTSIEEYWIYPNESSEKAVKMSHLNDEKAHTLVLSIMEYIILGSPSLD